MKRAPAPGPGPHDVVPFPRERTATLDTLRWARRRLTVPVLLEVDVTAARAAMRDYRERTGAGASFTAWVVACVARAASEHRRVHAVRRGKRQLVEFHEVDVAVLVERPIGRGETLPMPVVIRSAHAKSPLAIKDELRRAQASTSGSGTAAIDAGPPPWVQSLFFRLPRPVRDLVFWRRLVGSPTLIKTTMGTVVVTAAGMAAPGVIAWGIPLSLHPLAIGVGGITRRSTPDGPADVLALTVVFDHAVTDGAAVGRFIRRLHQLLSEADGLGALGRAPAVTPERPTPAR